MLKLLHIPAKIGALALLLSSALLADDRFVVKVNGDVNQLAARNNLSVVKSLSGSGTGIHVLQAPRGASLLQVLRNLANDSLVAGAESEKPLVLPGLSSTSSPIPSASRNTSPRLDGT